MNGMRHIPASATAEDAEPTKQGFPRLARFKVQSPVHGTATSTLVTLMTGITMQVLTLITGALTARLLGVEGRGAFAACTMLPSIVLMLGNLGGPISLTYFAAKRPESLARLTRQALVTGIVGGAILALILALLYPAFLRNYPGMFLAAAIPACIAIPFQLSSSQLNAVTQGSGKLIQFNLTRLLGPLVYCLVIAACFIAGIDRLDVLLWAPTIAAYAVFAAATSYRRPFNAERVTRDQVRETYSYGLRAHLGNITALDSLRIDLLLIVVFLSPSDAGLYAVAIAIASAVRAQASTIGYVAVPTIARNQDRTRAIEVARRFFLGTTAIIIALAAILGVVLHEALSLVYGPDFTAAATTTRILLVAMVFAAMRQSLGDISRALGFPGIASIAELWSWAAAAALLPILIPLFGLSGAATSVLIAYTVSFIVTGVLMDRRGISPIALVWPGWTPRAIEDVEELPPVTSARGEVGQRPWVGPALALTIALASGPFVVGMSPLYLILLCVGIVFAFLAFRYRRWINTIPRAFTREPLAEGDAQAAPEAAPEFAVPRLLYYFGLVLSGILIVRPVLGFTASDWVFYAALGAAALEYMLLKRGRGGYMPQLLLTGLAIFAVGAMLSSLSSPAPIGSLLVTAKFFYLILLWMWLGTLLISTPAQLRTAVACWVGGMALSGGLALIQANGIGTFWSAAATHNRYTGGADHPNDLGAQSAITMVPALYLLLTAKRPALRVVALAGIGCLALGLLLSGSVTALVTAVACLLLWFVAQARLSLRGVVVVVVAVVLAIGLLQLAETMNVSTPLDRFSSATDSSGSYCTSCQRVDNNTRALEEVIAQPIIGHGLDATGSKVDGGAQVHFMLLKAWFEAGILGLVGLAIVLLAFGAAAIQNLYSARSHDESRLALALMVAFVAFLLFGLSQPLLYQRYAWLPGAMILILRAQQVITARSSVQINPARSQPAHGIMRRPGFAEARTGPIV